MMTDAEYQDAMMIIGLALRSCAEGDARAHGLIVAEVYGYKKYKKKPEILQAKLDEIIAESQRHAYACPWVEE